MQRGSHDLKIGHTITRPCHRGSNRDDGPQHLKIVVMRTSSRMLSLTILFLPSGD